MAAVHCQGYPLRHSIFWDETECLNYYGMLSLHEVFDIVGSQLTETDIEVLSFLLKETFDTPHPLDPAGWTVEPREGDPDDSGVSPCSALLRVWRRLKPQGSQDFFVDSCKPTSGIELLLELERRGYISDGNLEPLLQLLRVLTRHDLLPFVSRKKRRTGKCNSQISDLEAEFLLAVMLFYDRYSFITYNQSYSLFFVCSFSRENWTQLWS